MPGFPAPHPKQISEVVESPVFLLLDPAVDHTRKDLPVSLYETGEEGAGCGRRGRRRRGGGAWRGPRGAVSRHDVLGHRWWGGFGAA